MKRPTFFEGVSIALAASLVGSILFTVMTPPFSGGQVLRLLIAVVGFGYSLYLLGRSPVRVGRITAVAFWFLVAGLSWFFVPSISLYLAMHLAAIWFIRSLYFYSSLLSALTDLGLTGFSLCSAIWAFIHTGSLFLAIWCFFLTQALFVFIPKRIGTSTEHPEAKAEDRFERAHRDAQAALRRISSIH